MKKTILFVCVAVLSFPQSLTVAHAEDLPPPIPEQSSVKTFETYEDYGKYLVVNKWGEMEWEAFKKIISNESGWTRTKAHYPSGYTVSGVRSSAHGLPGFLDATWKSVDCVKTDDGFKQLECAVRYIEKRYGTPSKALSHHVLKGWY